MSKFFKTVDEVHDRIIVSGISSMSAEEIQDAYELVTRKYEERSKYLKSEAVANVEKEFFKVQEEFSKEEFDLIIANYDLISQCYGNRQHGKYDVEKESALEDRGILFSNRVYPSIKHAHDVFVTLDKRAVAIREKEKAERILPILHVYVEEMNKSTEKPSEECRCEKSNTSGDKIHISIVGVRPLRGL